MASMDSVLKNFMEVELFFFIKRYWQPQSHLIHIAIHSEKRRYKILPYYLVIVKNN